MNTHYFRLIKFQCPYDEFHFQTKKYDLQYIGTDEDEVEDDYEIFSSDSVWSNVDLHIGSGEIEYKLYLDEQIQQLDRVITMTALGDNDAAEFFGFEMSYDEQLAQRDELQKEADKIQGKWTALAARIGPTAIDEQIHTYYVAE